MTNTIERMLADKSYLGWEPRPEQDPVDNETKQIVAVLAGAKPAAVIDWATGDYPFDAVELEKAARRHGAKLLWHRDTLLFDKGPELRTSLFVYRDDAACGQYIELKKRRILGDMPASEYHRAMGKLLGYPPAEVETFIDQQGRAKDEMLPRELEQILAGLRPAVHDELAKDPVMKHIIPPRQALGKGFP